MPELTVEDFDYKLPSELIAQHPMPERSGARLLDGSGALPVDRRIRDLPALLAPGDLLVFNDTRVIKARLLGEKPTGGAVEALVERVLPGHEVLAHLRASKSPRAGTTVRFAQAFDAEVLGRAGPEESLFRLRFPADPLQLLAQHGHVPLPPYITHADTAEDVLRYQTVFAARDGAVAAPTASLHFDQPLLDALAARGVQRAAVTLHVGAGTFQPVRSESIALHRMHSEWFEVGDATAAAVAAARARGGRVVAVGTTVLRALESAALRASASAALRAPESAALRAPESMALRAPESMALRASAAGPSDIITACAGETDLFITPGFEFRVVDRLLTNFHLPRSTLLMLVSAFSGHAEVKALYRHAVEARYRFFSYGDAMWLERRGARVC